MFAGDFECNSGPDDQKPYFADCVNILNNIRKRIGATGTGASEQYEQNESCQVNITPPSTGPPSSADVWTDVEFIMSKCMNGQMTGGSRTLSNGYKVDVNRFNQPGTPGTSITANVKWRRCRKLSHRGCMQQCRVGWWLLPWRDLPQHNDRDELLPSMMRVGPRQCGTPLKCHVVWLAWKWQLWSLVHRPQCYIEWLTWKWQHWPLYIDPPQDQTTFCVDFSMHNFAAWASLFETFQDLYVHDFSECNSCSSFWCSKTFTLTFNTLVKTTAHDYSSANMLALPRLAGDSGQTHNNLTYWVSISFHMLLRLLAEKLSRNSRTTNILVVQIIFLK